MHLHRGGVVDPAIEANARGVRLRPLERRIRRLVATGMPTDEIASRFRRNPGTIERVLEMSEFRRGTGAGSTRGGVLTPLERRILKWRAHGVSHDDIGVKFRRSADFVSRV